MFLFPVSVCVTLRLPNTSFSHLHEREHNKSHNLKSHKGHSDVNYTRHLCHPAAAQHWFSYSIGLPWIHPKPELQSLRFRCHNTLKQNLYGEGEKKERGLHDNLINQKLIDWTITNLYIPFEIFSHFFFIFLKTACQFMHIFRYRWSIIPWNKLPPTSLTAQHCYQFSQYKYNCKTLSWGKSSSPQ